MVEELEDQKWQHFVISKSGSPLMKKVEGYL